MRNSFKRKERNLGGLEGVSEKSAGTAEFPRKSREVGYRGRKKSTLQVKEAVVKVKPTLPRVSTGQNQRQRVFGLRGKKTPGKIPSKCRKRLSL